eukprot:GHVN01027653.1.p1 GENE.GHVN01027653.1~~GHVN01027653.1.p1  ORF type:complete len:202 (-),score=32.94 GHVN01027653.1:393-947(-)
MPRSKAQKEEEKDVFIMDDVLEYKRSRGKDLYLVKWKDYPVDEATWEPESNLLDPSEDIVRKINNLKAQKTAPPPPPPKLTSRKRIPSPAPPTPPAPPPPPKRAAGKRGRDDESKQAASGSQSGRPKITRLAVENFKGVDSLVASVQLDDGKIKQLNVKEARHEYTQELLDFLLSRIKFKQNTS